jgi:Na+-translocating ferredoxin:NAD+ oxidoreductase RNF subunit RnfB
MIAIVLITAAFALVLAFVLGAALGFFKEFFAVQRNPLAESIREALPGANCGACGFPGCENYALAIAAGNAPINACTVGGAVVAEKLAGITGSSGGAVEQAVAVLACQGSYLHAPQKGTYTGIASCRGAKLSAGGTKLCSWGCLGFGDCVAVCKFDGISMNKEKGLPVVDYTKCTGCRVCINECPQGLLKGIPKEQKGAMVLCSNLSANRQAVAKNCKISCIKCGLCVKNCPKQCIDLVGNIPVVDWSKCDSCGTCVEKCPTKVFKIIEAIIKL